MKRFGKGILAVSALCLSAGCIHLASSDPWMSGDVIGVKKAAPEPDLTATWRGEADPWKGVEKPPGAVIGGDSAFDKGKGAAAARSAASVSRGSPGVEREVRALAARVDRLERLVGTGAPAPAPRASAPALPSARAVEIYKVDPTGQTAWIAAGTRQGIQDGQTLQVMRGGKAVAQARVARIWPDASELTVLWANGKLQRGDSVTPR
ncbi:MAG: hypothetical protein ACYTKD_20470 [Planctomycetota bacterium]|jgi:hypothetical protein